MSARKDLATALRSSPSLPKKSYDVKDVADLPDTIRKTTIVIESAGYAPAPNALGTLITKWKVIVARPELDVDKAEDGLDADVPALLEALHNLTIENAEGDPVQVDLTWTAATPVLVKTAYRGVSIECSFPIIRPY